MSTGQVEDGLGTGNGLPHSIGITYIRLNQFNRSISPQILQSRQHYVYGANFSASSELITHQMLANKTVCTCDSYNHRFASTITA
jgi:hypothetical protein